MQSLRRVVACSYVIGNVLAIPAVHQQLVHDQQGQVEELDVVGDIDTLQHSRTERNIRDRAGAENVRLEQPFDCVPRRAGSSNS